MAKNTIKLKKYLDVIEEYEAAAAITPGMLLKLDSDGKVQKHDSAQGTAIPMFALEDELQGKGIAEDYASGDRVQVWIAQRGEQVYALLKDGTSVAIGDYLVSDGAGALKKYVAVDESVNPDDTVAIETEHNVIVAQALEAMDLTQSTAKIDDFPRIMVRVV